jgi:hypothetical protein
LINKTMELQKKACTILIKRRISGDPGPPSSLAHGELAFNEVDSALYINNPSLSSNDPGTF